MINIKRSFINYITISRILLRCGGSCPSVEMQLVYSKDLADWATEVK